MSLSPFVGFMVGLNHGAGVPDQRDGADNPPHEMVQSSGCHGEKSGWLCGLIDTCMLFQEVIYDQTVAVHLWYGRTIHGVRLYGFFCEVACAGTGFCEIVYVELISA